MKRFFSCLLALLSMIGVANAQRVWAYALQVEEMEGDHPVYNFTFIATADATSANLVFTDEDGNETGKVAIQNVSQGENVVELSLEQIPGSGMLNWAVELSGEAIAEVTEVTDDAVDAFHFYLPQGVAINNNPESAHFGKIYVANPQVGTDGLSEYTSTQTRGIYVFDPLLNLENEPGVGYSPFFFALGNTWDAIHRIAVDPKDGTVAFVKWDVEPFSVYAVSPDTLGTDVWWDTVAELTPDLNQPVALCYDNAGDLHVLCYDQKGEKAQIYSIYKVLPDGTTETFFSKEGWIVSGRSSIASDGKGGFWVVSKATDNSVATGKLMHVGKNGIDFEVWNDSDTLGLPVNFNRGQVAYDMQRDILAVGGGGKVTVYNVTYDDNGAPLMEKWTETPMYNPEKPAWNTDGIAFDYAGDMVVMSGSIERFYKFAMPTDNNTCTTPAPKAQVIEKDDTAVQNTTIANQKVRKVMVDGQLYVRRAGKLYTILGQQM